MRNSTFPAVLSCYLLPLFVCANASDASLTGANEDVCAARSNALIAASNANTTPCTQGLGAKSARVWCGSNGKLAYAKSPRGNQLMDFSSAGYGGGGVVLPYVRYVTTLGASGQDETAAVQAAIDAVSALPPNPNGFPGAVQLGGGTYTVSKTINITTSGVVVHVSRSSGAGATLLSAKGAPCVLYMWEAGKTSYTVTDKRGESGAMVLHLSKTTGLEAGQGVLIKRLVTNAWIQFMDMASLVRDGAPQTWIKPGTEMSIDRVIVAVQDDSITLNAPVADMMDMD